MNYDTEIGELENKLTDHNHDKYITTPEFNTLAADVFNSRLAKANLITKTDFYAKFSNLNRKINSNKSKNLFVENELKKLKTFDSIYFISKSHFEEDDTQNYLVFQPMYRYFNKITGVGSGGYIYYWRHKEFSDEKLTINLSYYGTKTRVEFNGSTLKQNKITFNHEIIENCLFGAVSLTTNADIDHNKYSEYEIGFDRHGSFSFAGIGLGRNG